MSPVFVSEYRGIKWPGSGYVHAFEARDTQTLCKRLPVKFLYKDAAGLLGWHPAYPWAEVGLTGPSHIGCKECRRRYERILG